MTHSASGGRGVAEFVTEIIPSNIQVVKQAMFSLSAKRCPELLSYEKKSTISTGTGRLGSVITIGFQLIRFRLLLDHL